jgi:hypothetical protein
MITLRRRKRRSRPGRREKEEEEKEEIVLFAFRNLEEDLCLLTLFT